MNHFFLYHRQITSGTQKRIYNPDPSVWVDQSPPRGTQLPTQVATPASPDGHQYDNERALMAHTLLLSNDLDSRSLIVFSDPTFDGKPYSCSACNYRCKQKSHIVQHVRIHTGEKPFKCSFCDLRSSRQANINKHERQKHLRQLQVSLPEMIPIEAIASKE